MQNAIINTQKLANTAIRAAHEAGGVLLRHFRKKLKVREKSGAGLVSDADFASEDKCISILKKDFPSFEFLAEEGGTGNSGRGPRQREGRHEGRWIIDPLDGTTNFVRGYPVFCVSIAAEWKGKVVVGVIFQPVLKETYVGILGKGAFVNKNRMKVSKTSVLAHSFLSTGFSYRKEEVLQQEVETFSRFSSITRGIRRPGSAALDLAFTARGVFDGFWERKLSPWDVAAGALLVQEAGGKVTNFKGNAFHMEVPEILATNGLLHNEMLSIIKCSLL